MIVKHICNLFLIFYVFMAIFGLSFFNRSEAFPVFNWKLYSDYNSRIYADYTFIGKTKTGIQDIQYCEAYKSNLRKHYFIIQHEISRYLNNNDKNINSIKNIINLCGYDNTISIYLRHTDILKWYSSGQKSKLQFLKEEYVQP